MLHFKLRSTGAKEPQTIPSQSRLTVPPLNESLCPWTPYGVKTTAFRISGEGSCAARNFPYRNQDFGTMMSIGHNAYGSRSADVSGYKADYW
jgi:hypothetical protein